MRLNALKNKDGEPVCNMQSVIGPIVRSTKTSSFRTPTTEAGFTAGLSSLSEKAASAASLYGEQTEPAKHETAI
jgi:hypothetical protein